MLRKRTIRSAAAAAITATAVATGTASIPSKAGAQASLEQMKALYARPETIPFPKDNPYTVEKAALGKKLYFDTRLSAANLLSCASCHSPAFGWGDGQPKGVGHNMKQLGRRSPTIVNAAFGQIFMWDGRAASLEEQALGPIRADVEMNLPIDQLMDKLKGISEYAPLFRRAFPKEGMSPETIAKAIATYERTVVSGRAPFDAWIEGDTKAISEEAKRGFVLFNTKAACTECHSGWNFTDDSFHDIGLGTTDIGRIKILPGVIKMQYAFKTPGLREISRRGPYMHNGSVPTLRDLLEPGDRRPARFYRGYDVYDRVKVGFVSEVAEEKGRRFFPYDTTLVGNSNRGHEGPRYGTELPPDDKDALVEYLKTF